MSTKVIWKTSKAQDSDDLENDCGCAKSCYCGGTCGNNCKCDYMSSVDADSSDSLCSDSKSIDSSCSVASYGVDTDSNSTKRSCELSVFEKLIHLMIRVISIVTLPMHVTRFVVLFIGCLFKSMCWSSDKDCVDTDSTFDSSCDPSTTECHRKRITTKSPCETTSGCGPCNTTTCAPTTNRVSTTSAPTTCTSTTVCCNPKPICVSSIVKKHKKDKDCETAYDKQCEDISTEDMSIGPASDADCNSIKSKHRKKHNRKQKSKN